MRVSACPLREEKRWAEGEGGGRGRAGGSTPTRGRDRRGKDDIDRSRADIGIPRSVGGRCHRRNGRRTSPPRDGRSPPRSMVPRPQQKSAPAPVSCRPRARDRRTARLSRYSQKPVYVTERVAFASGVLASRASPGRLGRDPSGRRWTAPRGREKKRVRDHVRRRETATARTARVERARTEVGQVVSHNKDERSGRAVRLMRAGEARASRLCGALGDRRRTNKFSGSAQNGSTCVGRREKTVNRADVRDSVIKALLPKPSVRRQRLTWLRILSSFSNAISLSARPEAL